MPRSAQLRHLFSAFLGLLKQASFSINRVPCIPKRHENVAEMKIIHSQMPLDRLLSLELPPDVFVADLVGHQRPHLLGLRILNAASEITTTIPQVQSHEGRGPSLDPDSYTAFRRVAGLG